MEILISFIVGIVLMETYAWLDPLAMWIVGRAAKELPEDRAEEFRTSGRPILRRPRTPS
jgi:hypothetical protein